MSIPRSESCLLFLVVFLVLFEFVGMAVVYAIKRLGRDDKKAGQHSRPPLAVKTLGRQGVALEIERLRKGGRVDEAWLRSMSAEDRVLFEVALIEALTGGPTSGQQRLRYVLIKHGYDELCARRLMRGSICDHVRAAILLSLLRPKPQAGQSKSTGP